jgi:DNA-binding response OmpR family regulator
VSVAIVEHDRVPSSLTNLLHGFGFQISAYSVDTIMSTGALLADILVIGAYAALNDPTRLWNRLRTAAYAGDVIVIVDSRKEGMAALDAGADDFVVEPLDVNELVSRMRASLRRNRDRWRGQWDELEIDRARRSARLRGKALTLTPREFDLLSMLVTAGGAVVSRADLLAWVWGLEQDPGSNLVEVHLSRLRDKLGPDARMIDTVRGAGYRLREG